MSNHDDDDEDIGFSFLNALNGALDAAGIPDADEIVGQKDTEWGTAKAMELTMMANKVGPEELRKAILAALTEAYQRGGSGALAADGAREAKRERASQPKGKGGLKLL